MASAIHIRFFKGGKQVEEHNTGDFRTLTGGVKRHYEKEYGVNVAEKASRGEKALGYRLATPTQAAGAPAEYDGVQVY